jgi:hypothetical protein
MNCASIMVISGSSEASKSSLLEELPEMLIENLSQYSCSVSQAGNLAYPNPEQSVITPVSTRLLRCKWVVAPTPVPSTIAQQEGISPYSALSLDARVPDSHLPSTAASAAAVKSPLPSCTSCGGVKDRALVCFNMEMFGICNHGCAIRQSASLGTKSVNGKISGRFTRFVQAGFEFSPFRNFSSKSQCFLNPLQAIIDSFDL